MRRQEYHRHFFINEGDGAVLHFGSGVTFGVDIGDLLQLEGPFQGYGEIEAAAKIKKVFRLQRLFSHAENMIILRKNIIHLFTHFRKGLGQAAAFTLRHAVVSA